MIPRLAAEQFETDIIEARRPRLASLNSQGKLREIGWKTVSTGDFEAYRQVVDAYFSFGYRRLKNTIAPIGFFASVVDLTVRGRKYTGGKRGELGFDREIYFHCLSIARRHKRELFHVYPDYRSTTRPIRELGTILCYGLRKILNERREWAFRRVQFRSSHEVQALQVSDILIGAIAYRLNRHYDAPNANADKKKLCDYILKKGDIAQYIGERSFREKAFGPFQLWFRRHKTVT